MTEIIGPPPHEMGDRPKMLDLFCKAGGAAWGYHLAGWDVYGVDIEPQPHYPFPFLQADALTVSLAGFDAIHASPPCQHYSALNNGVWGNAAGHPDLIALTRNRLQVSGLPYVIENVPGSPLLNPTILCGSMFNLRLPLARVAADEYITNGYLQRHRLFEHNFPLPAPPPCRHEGRVLGVYGHGRGGATFRGRTLGAADARAIMQMPWASRDEVAQAVPPAYTEWIGGHLLDALR